VSTPALLTIAETAATLRCSRRRVFQLLSDGTLVRGKRYGRQAVILAESVYAALEATYDPPTKRVRRARGAEKDAFDALLADVRSS
jgi:hypothetical protein